MCLRTRKFKCVRSVVQPLACPLHDLSLQCCVVLGDANEAAMHSPPPIAVLLLLCACSAHAANFGYFAEPGTWSLFGNNYEEIRQIGRVDLSTGEYVSAPNLAINTTREGFGDDTTYTGKNRIWYGTFRRPMSSCTPSSRLATEATGTSRGSSALVCSEDRRKDPW